jgi:hypothetical protein
VKRKPKCVMTCDELLNALIATVERMDEKTEA